MKKQPKHLQKKISDCADDPRKTILEHIQELRWRAIVTLSVFLFFTLAGYIIRERLIALFLFPTTQGLIYTAPAGGLDFSLRISTFFALLITIPVFEYHLLRFVQPLFLKSYTKIWVYITASLVLFITGISFSFFVAVPMVFHLLEKFGGTTITPMITTSEYFAFVSSYMVTFGLIFQIPLIFSVLSAVLPITATSLLRKERYVIAGSFIVAAVFTPTPDILNQSMIAIPIILLYQLTIVLVWISGKKHTLNA